ncbi:bifunctional aspartate kinase/homoserine dehydrogenase I [Flaviaesturariibacter amylovorans]|uniref:Bifunctional aspartate kinase/homoserine dehydrogenase I n=1 Tax=Flaviaesturariibacter amylovorans TaxID=1084520 RepID=A0ABP8GZ61_9BACT
MQVLKFGGTSMGSADAMRQVKYLLLAAGEKDRCVVVVSAMSGVTDTLLQAGTLAATQDPQWPALVEGLKARHLETLGALAPGSDNAFIVEACTALNTLCSGIAALGECSNRTRDRLAAFGELLSSQLFTAYLRHEGLDAAWVDSRRLIRTNSMYTHAQVEVEPTESAIRSYFAGAEGVLFVLPGFIAASAEGDTTTLGRGGSDYTAALLGAALGVPVEIWTDVPGMMTADPRLVPNARSIASLSFEEAMELSHFGAKVLYPPTVLPLMKRNLSVHIRNTFAPDAPGTRIHAQVAPGESIIRGLTSITGVALISLEGSGMVGIPGFSARLFGALARQCVNVILITQASSEHSICVGIEGAAVEAARAAVQEEFRNELRDGSIDPLQCESGLAIVALVGDRMKSHSGISGRLFSELGRNGVNIRAIAQGSSERNISTVIAGRDVRKAINVLHEAFFETSYKQVNLFIAGTGNVGRRLLAQLAQQAAWLEQHLRLQVRVTGLLNSRRMLLSEQGIALANWEEQLMAAEAADPARFAQRIGELNLRNSVFVDMTAQEAVAGLYESLLRRSCRIVACNKIAASSAYAHYRMLKDRAREFNAPFLFETNVGAGLPVISTLGDLMSSGDEVQRIEAVLSGTLNFVFNHYDGSASFASIVREAQAQGYTEPDPRLDLSGTDVARKILILAREGGASLEMASIANEPFLPASCLEGSIEDFYAEMERQEPHFRSLLHRAQAAGRRLKYVARFDGGRASVGLESVDPQHDFYHLYGKDNVVRFFTQRYAGQPLVVKGAGAGAEVTASGVFADIIKTARL